MTSKIRDIAVSEIMQRTVVTATEGMTVKELKELFDKFDYNAFPVVRDEKIIGIVTKLDLLKTITTGRKSSKRDFMYLWAETVGDIMRKAVVSVSPEDPINVAADYMVEFKLRSLPVVSKGRLVGILSRNDLFPHICVAEE